MSSNSNRASSSLSLQLLPQQTPKPSTMLRRFSSFGIILVGCVFLLILFVSHRLVTSTSFEYSPLQTIGRTIQSWSILEDTAEDKGEDYNYFFSIPLTDFSTKPPLPVPRPVAKPVSKSVAKPVTKQVAKSMTKSVPAQSTTPLTIPLTKEEEIEVAIVDGREKIKNEMIGYRYLNEKYNNSANPVGELAPEMGGQPLRSVIITTWRSGSTFLGDILNSHPANYYHYEPLLDFDIVQVRGPPNAKRALSVLNNLLNCNYTGLGHYLEYGKEHIWLFTHNTRLWSQCQRHPSICWLPEFLNPFCRLFPFQSMKIVRLRLRLIEDLLMDERLNIRVLLLVRDPRGTLQSRKHREWCPGNPDCDDPALLCADLVSDYSAALRLKAEYPDRFLVMRYEDLSLDPYEMVKQLFQFYGLDFHPDIRVFLDTHTKVDAGGLSSTYRNSKSAPFHWRQDLTYEEVRVIQSKCAPAMKYWGYVKAENATHQRLFHPIVDFKFP